MAVYDLEEQEQIDELKVWWQRYGHWLTAAALVATLAVAAWQGWNWWQRNQAKQAGALYVIVEEAARGRDAKRTREAAGELIAKFPGTAYASMGALLSARLQMDVADAQTAKAQLSWVVEHAPDPGLRDLARIRLASLYFGEKAYDEALKQLAAEHTLPFAPRFEELKGDVLSTQGKSAEARAAYQMALNKLDELQKSAGTAQRPGPYRELLQVKLDAQHAAAPTASVAPAATAASAVPAADHKGTQP